MKNLFGMLVWLVLAATAFSQPVDPADGATQARDVGVELARIRSQRAEEEAHYAREQAACYDRFAVTDCLRRARAHRREVLDKLRHREIAINDAERKRKAQEALERIRQKSQALSEPAKASAPGDVENQESSGSSLTTTRDRLSPPP